MTKIKSFCTQLEKHTKRKANLYDGFNNNMHPDYALRLATEELGEIASAITRDRLGLAEKECIDLAHCAFLILEALSRIENK